MVFRGFGGQGSGGFRVIGSVFVLRRRLGPRGPFSDPGFCRKGPKDDTLGASIIANIIP